MRTHTPRWSGFQRSTSATPPPAERRMEAPRGAAARLRSGGASCALLRTAAEPQPRRRTPRCGQPGVFLILASVLSLLPVGKVSSHPQCLDFQPPFRPPTHLEFCSQYELLGCCDQDADNAIAERYWDVIEYLDVQGAELCDDVLKEIMCQVRWSAHTACSACQPGLQALVLKAFLHVPTRIQVYYC